MNIFLTKKKGEIMIEIIFCGFIKSKYHFNLIKMLFCYFVGFSYVLDWIRKLITIFVTMLCMYVCLSEI